MAGWFLAFFIWTETKSSSIKTLFDRLSLVNTFKIFKANLNKDSLKGLISRTRFKIPAII